MNSWTHGNGCVIEARHLIELVSVVWIDVRDRLVLRSLDASGKVWRDHLLLGLLFWVDLDGRLTGQLCPCVAASLPACPLAFPPARPLVRLPCPLTCPLACPCACPPLPALTVAEAKRPSRFSRSSRSFRRLESSRLAECRQVHSSARFVNSQGSLLHFWVSLLTLASCSLLAWRTWRYNIELFHWLFGPCWSHPNTVHNINKKRGNKKCGPQLRQHVYCLQ